MNTRSENFDSGYHNDNTFMNSTREKVWPIPRRSAKKLVAIAKVNRTFMYWELKKDLCIQPYKVIRKYVRPQTGEK